MVAWCTKKGHGTRVMPANTLQSVQVLNAPGYVMITGVIDQSLLDLDPTDPGGEEDFGGQDLVRVSLYTVWELPLTSVCTSGWQPHRCPCLLDALRPQPATRSDQTLDRVSIHITRTACFHSHHGLSARSPQIHRFRPVLHEDLQGRRRPC